MCTDKGTPVLKAGDHIGLCACSNAVLPEQCTDIERLCTVLCGMGLVPVVSPCLYAKDESGVGAPAKERAESFMRFFMDDRIRAVFDVSGGDLANGVLDFLDFDVIRRKPKPLFGYSDLTAVLNTVFCKTGIPAYLYQIRNLCGACAEIQRARFYETLFAGGQKLFSPRWHFVQGTYMRGTLIGGNIRCFLKLAGTPFMPEFTGRVLFLESLSGGPARIASYLFQLKQLGAFGKIAGLLLGTFTQMENEGAEPDAAELALRIAARSDLPVAKTMDVGHGGDSRCLVIGKEIEVCAEDIRTDI